MFKEAIPAGCCSHGFWAPGTPVGWGGGSLQGQGKGEALEREGSLSMWSFC